MANTLPAIVRSLDEIPAVLHQYYSPRQQFGDWILNLDESTWRHPIAGQLHRSLTRTIVTAKYAARQLGITSTELEKRAIEDLKHD